MKKINKEHHLATVLVPFYHTILIEELGLYTTALNGPNDKLIELASVRYWAAHLGGNFESLMELMGWLEPLELPIDGYP